MIRFKGTHYQNDLILCTVFSMLDMLFYRDLEEIMEERALKWIFPRPIDGFSSIYLP
jgi:transposase-like protein